jgi:hypothetical protein
MRQSRKNQKNTCSPLGGGARDGGRDGTNFPTITRQRMLLCPRRAHSGTPVPGRSNARRGGTAGTLQPHPAVDVAVPEDGHGPGACGESTAIPDGLVSGWFKPVRDRRSGADPKPVSSMVSSMVALDNVFP